MLQRNNIFHIAGLVISLMLLWLLLSGHYTPLLISLGLLSVVLVICISLRMNLIAYNEPEVLLQASNIIPYSFYGIWLVGEILKSNIDVCKRILHPALPIKPGLITVKASQRSELAKVTYANSITLTPGTISIDVRGNTIEVHALADSGIEGLETGEMDRRISKAEMKNNV
jgi:multicomponent Na+:H+ antiporter subunit E